MSEGMKPVAYEVVEAVSMADALDKSEWQEGDKAVCVEVRAAANGNGTYSVFPGFAKEKQE